MKDKITKENVFNELKEEMERIITFKDKNKNIVKLEINLEDGKLSICGEAKGHCGQCQDSIIPKNKEQSRLLEIWEKWHLNDMKAGTPKQEEAIEEFRQKNNISGWAYDKEVEYLKSIKLYNDKGYKYGTSWLTKKLPDTLEEEIINLCNTIEEIEQEEKQGKSFSELTEEEINKLLEEYTPEVLALAKHLDLTVEEIKEINQDDNNLTYGGIDYFVGTQEEAEEEARDYLSQDDLWREAVKAGNTTLGLDDWIQEVIDIDGIGHLLNGWDGSEDSEEINGQEYFICRR